MIQLKKVNISIDTQSFKIIAAIFNYDPLVVFPSNPDVRRTNILLFI